MQTFYLSESALQTKRIGKIFAKKVFKINGLQKAVIIGLEGDLGGGKTTFLQGFAKGLGIKEKILSPTFVIMKKFGISKPGFKNFYHFDCYRIERIKDISELGFKKIVSNPQNVVAFEWADRIKKILPRDSIWIKFKFINKNKREIVIK